MGAGIALLSGCSTVTVPVLRHETAETLGAGKFKASAKFESSRIFPYVPSGSEAATALQKAEIFQSSLVGFSGAAGAWPRLDFQISGVLSARGGGWRLGSKYQLGRKGGFVFALMAGYGAYSSAGTITYETGGYTQDLEQVFSVKSFDLAFPVSYRLSQSVAAYSGVMFIRSGVNGTVAGTAITEVANDLGLNLGIRVDIGKFEADVETAVLRLYDPFSNSMRFVPYLGIGGGVNF